MRYQYKIGKAKSNDIILADNHLPDHCAIINYEKGNWVLKAINDYKPIFVNQFSINEPIVLSKEDKIRIGNHKIHWCNYLNEGNHQELTFKDIIRYQGRINLSNFRSLSLLLIGLICCVFFLLGLIGSSSTINSSEAMTQFSMPIIYAICYPLILILFALISIKK